MSEREGRSEGAGPGPPDYGADATLRPDRPEPGSPEEPVDAEGVPRAESGLAEQHSPHADWVEELEEEGTSVGPTERNAEERRE